jgi:hypothetical protein
VIISIVQLVFIYQQVGVKPMSYKNMAGIVMLLVIFIAINTLPVSAQTNFSGTLANTDPTITSRANSISLGFQGTACETTRADTYYYDTFTFQVSVDGYYEFDSTASFDETIILYNGSFDPSAPLTNCIQMNDDDPAGGTLEARIPAVYLTAGTNYVLVATSFCCGSTGTYSINMRYLGATYTPPTAADCPVFLDGRINSCDTGTSVVLYGQADADDYWRLDVYAADGSGLLVSISASTIAAVATCPESNTLIVSDDATGISLWRLPERTVTVEGVRICPFQLNAPATEAGKTYIIIFDELYPNTYYESHEEVIGQ